MHALEGVARGGDRGGDGGGGHCIGRTRHLLQDAVVRTLKSARPAAMEGVFVSRRAATGARCRQCCHA
jgi:hypothetical protein